MQRFHLEGCWVHLWLSKSECLEGDLEIGSSVWRIMWFVAFFWGDKNFKNSFSADALGFSIRATLPGKFLSNSHHGWLYPAEELPGLKRSDSVHLVCQLWYVVSSSVKCNVRGRVEIHVPSALPSYTGTSIPLWGESGDSSGSVYNVLSYDFLRKSPANLFYNFLWLCYLSQF